METTATPCLQVVGIEHNEWQASYAYRHCKTCNTRMTPNSPRRQYEGHTKNITDTRHTRVRVFLLSFLSCAHGGTIKQFGAYYRGLTHHSRVLGEPTPCCRTLALKYDTTQQRVGYAEREGSLGKALSPCTKTRPTSKKCGTRALRFEGHVGLHRTHRTRATQLQLQSGSDIKKDRITQNGVEKGFSSLDNPVSHNLRTGDMGGHTTAHVKNQLREEGYGERPGQGNYNENGVEENGW